MFKKLSLLAAVLITPALQLQAQDQTSGDPAVPGSARACRLSIAEYRDSVYRLAREAKKAVDTDSLTAGMMARSADCAKRFNIDEIEISQLHDLGALYVGSMNIDQARLAFQRIIDNKELSDETRAEGIAIAMETLRRAPVSDSGIVWAEEYLPVVDAINGVPAQKFRARYALVGFYLGRDIDDKLRPTSEELISLARQMNDTEQKASAKEIARSYSILASLHGSGLHTDSAIALLEQAPNNHKPISASLKRELKPTLDRYKLVGKKIPTLLADYWIGNKVSVPSKQPTLLMFTANWCPSCKKSYASVKELSAKYEDQGLQTVLAVTLDGVFEGLDMEPKQEFEANRKYFTEKEGLTFPVAIQKDYAGEENSPTPNAEAFRVGGYPQFMVIDRQGIVRAIILGWDPYGNRERALSTALAQVM